MIIPVKDIQEINDIPYAIYDKNTNNIELPISIEVIPHKTILIANANVHTQVIRNRNNLMLNIYKCIFIIFFAIPAGLVLISFFVRMP
jgi:hypothetical protein